MKKKPLNKVAKAWVKALRSEEFTQAHRTLGYKDGTRCCLGVLCELAKKSGIIKRFKLDATYLPEVVRKWANLTTEDARYDKSTESDAPSLWKDNDGWGAISKKSFSEIAAIIESQPEGLFIK